MGRKSLAEKFYKKAGEDYEEEAGTWLVLYDFKGFKANVKFWNNLRRVMDMSGGSLIQYSVFRTSSFRSAVTVLRLARYYGGEAVMYRAEEKKVK